MLREQLGRADRGGTVAVIHTSVATLASTGDAENAARLSGSLAGEPEPDDMDRRVMQRYQHLIDDARSELGDERWRALEDEGARLDADALMRVAIDAIASVT